MKVSILLSTAVLLVISCNPYTRSMNERADRADKADKSAGEIVGWVALSPVSSRCVYQGVAEVSLYVKSSARGQGVGKALLRVAIEESERIGIWTLQAGIFPENAASIALARACGFREVGVREKIGRMNGKWRDVILMERRSKLIGH